MEHEDQLLCPKTEDEVLTHNSTNGRDSVQNGMNGRHTKEKEKEKKKKEKEKPVKIQQRGLGVAELEKLRILEEQNTKGVEISSPLNRVNTPLLPDNLCKWPPLFTNTPTLHPCNNCYSYVPGIPHLNVGHQSATHLNNAGREIGCPTSFFATEDNGRNHMTSEFAYNRDMEVSPWSVHNANISNRPNQLSTFPIQLGNQKNYYYSPSKADHVAANSLSAVLNFQTEPPSNQSLCGTYRSVQPDEAYKIVAAKRQHLFSPHDLPDPIAHCKYNPFMAPHGLERSNSLQTQGQSSFATNGNPTLREGLPCSVSMPNLQLRKDTNTDCAMLDSGFLKLGPLATMPLRSGLKSKQASSYEDTHQAELPNIDSTIHRVRAQGSNLQGGSNMSANHQQQAPNPTFPPAFNNTQNGQSTVSSNHNNGDTEDNLDLSLSVIFGDIVGAIRQTQKASTSRGTTNVALKRKWKQPTSNTSKTAVHFSRLRRLDQQFMQLLRSRGLFVFTVQPGRVSKECAGRIQDKRR